MSSTMPVAPARSKPQAYLRVGYACNGRCTFCCAQGGWSQPMRKLEELKREIDKMVGKMDLESISISGGEPTIHPDILEVIRYCKQNAFRNIHLNSNGREFKTREIVDQYVEAGMNSVMIGIHGPNRELQEGIHRVKGSFDQMVAGVKNIAAAGLFHRFFTVICKANMDHLPEIVRFCNDTFHGFHSMIFCYPVIKELEGFDKDSILIPYSQVQPRIQAAIEKGIELGVRVQAQLVPPCLLGEYHYLATEIRRPDFFASEPTHTKLTSFIEEDRLLLPTCRSCEAKHFCPRIQYDYVRYFADLPADIFRPLRDLDYRRVSMDTVSERNIPL